VIANIRYGPLNITLIFTKIAFFGKNRPPVILNWLPSPNQKCYRPAIDFIGQVITRSFI